MREVHQSHRARIHVASWSQQASFLLTLTRAKCLSRKPRNSNADRHHLQGASTDCLLPLSALPR